MNVVTRFAPSPTGWLHVGGARTALFSYFFARRHKGKFILRIEDTDTERSKKEYETEILASMKWLGLDWDADPIYQTQRFDLCRDYALRLLKEGKAYKCWATPAELDQMRAEQQAAGKKAMYDRRYRDFAGPEPTGDYVIRFKMPLSGETVLKDQVKGEIRFPNEEMDDLVILRSNGVPTYNFMVVVDDALMKITHVIRGDDHVNNTPKQMLMMEALGFAVPFYAHVPMILGPDKAKLSKRHGAVAVTNYRDLGYLPEAMLNYLARLGWSHGDQEIFSKEELCTLFGLDGCGSSPSVFDTTKLDWVNAHHIKQKTPAELARLCKENIGWDGGERLLSSPSGEKLFLALRERAVRLTDFRQMTAWYFDESFAVDAQAKSENLGSSLDARVLPALTEALSALPSAEFTAESAFGAIKATAAALGLKMPQVAKPARVLATGTLQSPDLGLCLEALGRERVLARLGSAKSAP
jgi:glutamyl-tRNA synthetase